MKRLPKYPKTVHLEDSRLPPDGGGPSLFGVRWEALEGRYVVVEEKVDGSEAAIGFSDDLDLFVQTRGSDAPRDKNFTPLYRWASVHCDPLWDVLENRYVLFGMWTYLKHTVYYDRLPNPPLLEFDIFDRQTGHWLGTEARHEIVERLAEAGARISSVPVLASGLLTPDGLDWPEGRRSPLDLAVFAGRSTFKSDNWVQNLVADAQMRKLDVQSILDGTFESDRMEGIYVKVEDQGRVVGNYKWVQYGFLKAILDSRMHWKARPALPNRTVSG